jgi:2-keto-4-pentenoate hydratase/2-oxohepta-3-ene-1,7-dioic acid hydratase in catechol pathway
MKWCRFQIGAQLSHGIVEDDTKLLAPVIPRSSTPPGRTAVVISKAWRSGAESRPRYPARPKPKLRSPRAIIGPGDSIVVPKESTGAVQPEGQLAVVIGRKASASGIAPSSAPRTATRSSRSARGSSPGSTPASCASWSRHNGTVWEDFSSADQIWDTATWIHEMSKTTTLHPGDVLWMGTEGADGNMVPGDVIEVEISGIGTLRNPIVAET